MVWVDNGKHTYLPLRDLAMWVHPAVFAPFVQRGMLFATIPANTPSPRTTMFPTISRCIVLSGPVSNVLSGVASTLCFLLAFTLCAALRCLSPPLPAPRWRC